ncbi:hypothetical protein GJ496_000474 [Pomphorhynchus laevis]|nr:hypothetical protein GJ496_000474 [Pomphorhynchus laevis]
MLISQRICSITRVSSFFRAGYRLLSTINVDKLQCIKYGEPIVDSLQLNTSKMEVEDRLPNEHVILKLVASSINPADINVIQGKYGNLPKTLPETIGNEGLFEVIKSGCQEDFKEGDWAIVKSIGTGTWCSHLRAHKNDLIRMDKKLGVDYATTLLVNPVTAYLLLHSFVKLAEGENVIINAPTSIVGRSLIQICKSQYLQSTCILRDEQINDSALKQELTDLGATYIISNSNLRDKTICADIPKARLALNCVGGKHATDMMRLALEGCTMVTYGGLSLQPVTAPTGSLIFRDHRFFGFWLSRWRLQNAESGLLEGVISELTQMALEKKLILPKLIMSGCGCTNQCPNPSKDEFFGLVFILALVLILGILPCGVIFGLLIRKLVLWRKKKSYTYPVADVQIDNVDIV